MSTNKALREPLKLHCNTQTWQKEHSKSKVTGAKTQAHRDRLRPVRTLNEGPDQAAICRSNISEQSHRSTRAQPALPTPCPVTMSPPKPRTYYQNHSRSRKRSHGQHSAWTLQIPMLSGITTRRPLTAKRNLRATVLIRQGWPVTQPYVNETDALGRTIRLKPSLSCPNEPSVTHLSSPDHRKSPLIPTEELQCSSPLEHTVTNQNIHSRHTQVSLRGINCTTHSCNDSDITQVELNQYRRDETSSPLQERTAMAESR